MPPHLPASIFLEARNRSWIGPWGMWGAALWVPDVSEDQYFTHDV